MNQVPKERFRPYDTSEPAALNDVISKLFAQRGFGRVQADRQLHVAWNKTAGDDLAKWTKVLSLKNGTLQIGVANSALLGELVSFRTEELLARFRAENPQVRVGKLKFKLRGDLMNPK